MHKINRRDFLKTGLATVCSLNAPAFLTGGNTKESIRLSEDRIKSQVAAIRGRDLGNMTRDAVDALGGMSTIVNKDETVFIKPNFVSFPWAKYNDCFRKGECTKPEIIITVIDECLKAGAAEVIVGEGSHLPTFDWQYAVTLDGQSNLQNEAQRLAELYNAKVTLACLETDSPGWFEIPSSTHMGIIAISSLVAGADKIISIPVAKTHSWAQLTLSLKNFIGITPLHRYAQLVNNAWWNRGAFDHSSPQAIGQVYLDIVKHIKPDLAIIDFSIGMEGDGPTLDLGGRTLDVRERLGSWAIIASKDIMAADATAARIMSHDVNKVSQLTMGFNMDLGEIRKEAIELSGENLDNLVIPWKSARLKG